MLFVFSAGDTSELKGTTLRYSGLVLVVSLQYTNLVAGAFDVRDTAHETLVYVYPPKPPIMRADTNSFSEQVMQVLYEVKSLLYRMRDTRHVHDSIRCVYHAQIIPSSRGKR